MAAASLPREILEPPSLESQKSDASMHGDTQPDDLDMASGSQQVEDDSQSVMDTQSQPRANDDRLDSSPPPIHTPPEPSVPSPTKKAAHAGVTPSMSRILFVHENLPTSSAAPITPSRSTDGIPTPLEVPSPALDSRGPLLGRATTFMDLGDVDGSQLPSQLSDDAPISHSPIYPPKSKRKRENSSLIVDMSGQPQASSSRDREKKKARVDSDED